MRVTLLAAVLLAAPAVSAAGAALPPSPADSSDTVLAAHAQGEGELRLSYQKDVDGGHPETLSIALARDYDSLQTPTSRTLHDYRLRRTLRYQPAFIATYVNDSLYADIWRRATEIQRRLSAVGHIEKAGIGPEKGQLALAPFWAESELGLIDPSFPRPLALTHSETPERDSWRLDGLEVVAVRWHADPVPEEVRKGLRRLWPALAPVHPSIADALAASARVPDELWVEAPGPDPKHLVRLHWKLTGSQWVADAPFPLPPRLRAAPTLDTGLYPEVFTTLTRTVEQRLRPPPASTYLERMQASITAGDGLTALLWQMEMRLAGESTPECLQNSHSAACALGQLAGSLAEADDRTELALAAQSPPLKAREAFADLPNGYVLGSLWATKPPGAKVTPAQSEKDMLQALKASPVPGFAKNAGDFYAGQWQGQAAWQVWDLGRLMAAHRPGDTLAEIDTLEQRLPGSYPEFF